MPLATDRDAIANPMGDLANLLDAVSRGEVDAAWAARLLAGESQGFQPCAAPARPLAEAIISYIAEVAPPERRTWGDVIALATAAASSEPFDTVMSMLFELAEAYSPTTGAARAWRTFSEGTTSAEARACAIDLVCAVRERALGVKAPAGARV